MSQYINDRGIEEIKQFLADNHKKGGDHFSPCMLRAWASEAEFQLGEGNPPTIEIRSWDSIHGCTQTYTISDDGLYTVSDDDEEAEDLDNARRAGH